MAAAATSFCTGAGLGATDDEAVEADGGLEATLLVGDLTRPASKELLHLDKSTQSASYYQPCFRESTESFLRWLSLTG